MKIFVLDSNILIKDSSILKKWSPNYKFIVPDIVFEEATYVNSNLTRSKRLSDILENSKSKNFISITNINRDKNNYQDRPNQNLRISWVDFQIAHYTLELSREEKNVFLVTDDRKLMTYAEEIGVKAINLFDLQREIAKEKITNIDQLGQAENIIDYQKSFVRKNLFYALFACIFIAILFNYFGEIHNRAHLNPFLLAAVFFPFIFYYCRCHAKIAYGIAEFFFGFLCIMYIINPAGDNFTTNFDDIDIYISSLSGLYVMVRGIDNFAKGLKGTLIEKPWRRIFNDE